MPDVVHRSPRGVSRALSWAWRDYHHVVAETDPPSTDEVVPRLMILRPTPAMGGYLNGGFAHVVALRRTDYARFKAGYAVLGEVARKRRETTR